MITKTIICEEIPELWRDNKPLLLYAIPIFFLVIPYAIVSDIYNKFAKGRVSE